MSKKLLEIFKEEISEQGKKTSTTIQPTSNDVFISNSNFNGSKKSN